ncbi:hypothetical protein ACS0TY_025624 [Phlomoides rotata]
MAAAASAPFLRHHYRRCCVFLPTISASAPRRRLIYNHYHNSIPGLGKFTSLLLPIHANDNGKTASSIRATERRQLLCYCTETEVQNSNTESTTLDEKDSAVREAANTLDIRVGRILKAWRHEEADSLYVEEVDVGEPEPRIICSGLVKYIPLHLLQDRNVIVLANLKPRNMRGVKSNGMLMAASDAAHENVELLVPPEGAVAGDRVWFGSVAEKDNLPDVASPNQ